MTASAALAERKAAWERGEYTTYQPRRRRTVVCPHLREDGEAIPPAAWPSLWARLPKTLTAYGSIIAARTFGRFRCTRRGGEVSASFVTDRCASSWCHGCEWREPEPLRSPDVSLSFQRRGA